MGRNLGYLAGRRFVDQGSLRLPRNKEFLAGSNAMSLEGREDIFLVDLVVPRSRRKMYVAEVGDIADTVNETSTAAAGAAAVDYIGCSQLLVAEMDKEDSVVHSLV